MLVDIDLLSERVGVDGAPALIKMQFAVPANFHDQGRPSTNRRVRCLRAPGDPMRLRRRNNYPRSPEGKH